jgi:hypothetical protein
VERALVRGDVKREGRRRNEQRNLDVGKFFLRKVVAVMKTEDRKGKRRS